MGLKRFIFWLMLGLVVILPFFLMETFARIFYSEYIRGQENIPSMVSAIESSFIKRKNINGQNYYYSDYLPVRYYYADKSPIGHNLAVDKTDSVFRIFTFGGSSTAGSPFGNWGSFSRFLLDGLNSIRKNHCRVEVFNCGISSGSTMTALLILKRLLFLRPDLIIVYAGHNEGVEIVPRSGEFRRLLPGKEDLIKFKGKNKGLTRKVSNLIYSYSYAFRLINILHTRWRQNNSEIRKYKPFDEHPCCNGIRRVQSKSELNEITEQYRRNVEDIIGLANDIGSKVLLVSQPANMFIAPGDFAKKNTSFDTKRENRFIRAIMRRMKNEEILGEDSQIIEEGIGPSWSHYLLGLYWLRRNKVERARMNLTLAMELDYWPRRFRPITYTRILSELSQKYDNTHFLDIYEDLSELVSDGLVDGRIILDVMHPAMELNKYIAIKILEKYFIESHLRIDLFDYNSYHRKSLLGPFPEEKLYRLFCARYYDAEWGRCLSKGLENLSEMRKSADLAGIHRGFRIWEPLFYYGRVCHQDWALSEALKLFQPWTLHKYMRSSIDTDG